MFSAGHSRNLAFNPSAIPLFSVIRVPYVFDGANVLKRFVVISHANAHAFCLKTTSQTETFDADPSQLQGVVVYETGECPLFQKRTIIDPRNQFPIAHSALVVHESNGNFENPGVLPADFKARLIEAITKSRVIERNRKKRLLSQL
jgi:hypothetical protein